MQGFPANELFDDAKTSRPKKVWLVWVNFVQAIVAAARNYGNALATVIINGFAYTVPAGFEIITFTPAAGIAGGTATLPLLPFSGQRVYFNTTQDITTFVVAANTGNLLASTFTAKLAANSGIGYYFNQANNTWYRII